MDTDRLIQLYNAANLGTEPDDLTDEERPRYERAKAEVEAMRERGETIEMPFEI